MAELEECPGCKSWCCTRDISWCSGHPVGLQPIPALPGSNSVNPNLIAAVQSARVHPPKRGSCMDCELPGWRSCNSTFCWSQTICPECASGGVTCLCQEVWACDLCAEHNTGIFIRCPRCNRPFCCSCSYVDQCQECHRTNLCNDCVEEESDVGDELMAEFPEFVVSCEGCQAKVCDRCVSQSTIACKVCSRRLRVCRSSCCCCKSLCDDCLEWLARHETHDEDGTNEGVDVSLNVEALL